MPLESPPAARAANGKQRAVAISSEGEGRIPSRPPAIRPGEKGGGFWRAPLAWLPRVLRLARGQRGPSRKHRLEMALGLEEMRRFTGETEREILRLGETVQEFFLAAQAMTEQGSRVVELVSSQAVADTTQRLEQLVGQVRARFEGSRSLLAENVAILASVRKEVTAAGRPLAGFRQMVMGLRVLGIATRIESARMQGADEGFQFLAEEVSRLADTIQEQTEGMEDRLGSLSARLGQTLGSMSGLDAGLSGGMGNLDAVVDQSLMGLRQWRVESELAAGRVAASTRQVHADVGEVVSSMQFHDITRQRLEHVDESLTSLIEGGTEASPTDVCGLQAELLANAREELVQAVDSIRDSLLGIAGSVRQVAQDAQLLTRGEGGGEVSVLEGLETDLARIMAIGGQTEDALARLRDLVGSVLETLEQVGASLGSIERISYAIKFVALNAAIKSARLGVEGAALGSLAQAIQRLSAEAHAATQGLTTGLGNLEESAESLRRNMAVDSETEDQAMGDLQAVLESIRSDNRACNQSLLELEQNGRNLAASLEEGAAGIHFHLDIGQGIEAVMDALNRFLNRAKRKGREAGSGDRAAQTSRHYTMASERRIHQAWARDEAPRPKALAPARKAAAWAPALAAGQPAGAATTPADEDLGDNVELF